ncbi:hypothetical protein C8Q80DRAFT_1221352 [Daedaleopsis nitida]|nr:hypothetical protein C8Q80DRAFT_1221352 [Daedaleopsis nitida]
MKLVELDDDVLVCIYGFLPVASILRLRQTCVRLAAISKLRIIWLKACVEQVLDEGYPFPSRTLTSSTTSELERLALHALGLGTFWLSPSDTVLPPHVVEFQASTGTGVSHVRFLPGHGGRYVLTVYKGIWSMISCWDVTPESSTPSSKPRKAADWCPKNTIFAGFVTNSDPDSEAGLAVAVQHGGGAQSIEVLSLFREGNAKPSFRSVCNIATGFRPIALNGDLIAFSDDASETVVMNWRENTFALLRGAQRPVDERFQYNRCLQVVFAYKSILVVRARSVELFPEPVLRPTDGEYTTYQPIGFHTFGWIDGVSVKIQTGPRVDANGTLCPPGHEPLSILLRAESDDPWASDVHKLEQFVLHPNPSSGLPLPSTSPVPGDTQADVISAANSSSSPDLPYLFPPVREQQTSPTVRGVLRCRDIVLGPAGTALWIQPRAARAAHLTGYDVHSSVVQLTLADGLDPDTHVHPVGTGIGAVHRESLCAGVFEGPLLRRHRERERERERERAAPTTGEHESQVGPGARILWVQPDGKEGCHWTAVDYDEESGRAVVGSSDGSVQVLDLV